MLNFFIKADSNSKKLSAQAYLLLAALCLIFFLPGFFTLPPIDRDEPHFAQATKQMLETGDYADIRFQEEARYKKPIGIYWLQAIAVKATGANIDNISAYRLPSLVGATTAVLMTAALGSLFFGPLAGLCAALMLLSSLVLNVEARLAKTDAALLGSLMVAEYALANAFVSRSLTRNATILNFFAFWGGLTLAILIKGPIPLLPIVGTLLALLKWGPKSTNNRADMGWLKKLHPIKGVIFALMLILPWFLWISFASHGTFLQESAGKDLFAKIWQMQAKGSIGLPGVHLLALPVVFFPASILILLSLPDIWHMRKDSKFLFCLGWIIPTWIVFEFTLTKLPHYVLPTYPALAILAAKVMIDGFPTIVKSGKRWVITSLTCLWLLVGTSGALFLVYLPKLVDNVWAPSGMIAGFGLVILQSVAILFLAQRQNTRALVCIVGGMWLYCFTAFGQTLPHLQNFWLTERIMAAKQKAPACAQEMPLLVDSFDEPSLIFRAGTNTKIIHNGGVTAAEMQTKECALAIVPDKHRDAFESQFSSNLAGKKTLIPLDHIEGYNLGSGRPVALTLYLQKPSE